MKKKDLSTEDQQGARSTPAPAESLDQNLSKQLRVVNSDLNK